jgi:hypothetical protein
MFSDFDLYGIESDYYPGLQKCANCGSDDICATAGGEHFCGDCWNERQAEKKRGGSGQ